jgi:hypothetical protein
MSQAVTKSPEVAPIIADPDIPTKPRHRPHQGCEFSNSWTQEYMSER